jgi:hypothetical protein
MFDSPVCAIPPDSKHFIELAKDHIDRLENLFFTSLGATLNIGEDEGWPKDVDKRDWSYGDSSDYVGISYYQLDIPKKDMISFGANPNIWK